MGARRKIAMKTRRHADLRRMLEERRDALRMQVHGKRRDARLQQRHDSDVPGQGEMLEIDVREDIDLALIQMTSETLGRIDVALARLEQGTYDEDCLNAAARSRRLGCVRSPLQSDAGDCEEMRESARRASTRVASGML